MKKIIILSLIAFLSIFALFSIQANASGKYIGSKNNVYGKLTHKVKKLPGGLYKDKSMSYVYYGKDSDKTINVVKEDFRKLPLNDQLDSESISEHTTDFMENDAVQSGKDENGNLIYSSAKIGKKYLVKYTRNTNGDISRITIFRGDLNEIN